MSALERRWQMTKLSAGDWLLPSNDLGTIYRLTRYDDGRSHGLDRGPELVQLWALRSLPMERFSEERSDVHDLADWHELEFGLRSRGEAVQAALRAEERRTIEAACPGCSDRHLDRRCCRCGQAEHPEVV